MIFNKSNNGATELTELLGFLDKATNFKIWKTWISLSVGVLKGAVGDALYKRAEAHYKGNTYEVPTEAPAEGEQIPSEPATERAYSNEELDELVHKIQLANALFAYVKILPTLDAGHSNTGRSRALGEYVRGLTAVEAYKDEANILALGYEALENLIQYAEEMQFPEWKAFLEQKRISTLLIQSREVFDRYFTLNSARMFYALVPMMHDVQRNDIIQRVSSEQITAMLEAEKVTEQTDDTKKIVDILVNYVRPAIVYGTMIKALNRLPVEIFPEGLLQTQITGTVKEKKTATEEARKAMVESLKEDMKVALQKLEDVMTVLSGTPATEIYVPVAREMGTGFGF